MGEIIEDMGGVLSFTLFKVEKGREKICRCNPPHYEIDPVNRIVTCGECGATIDAFEALVSTCNYADEFRKYQEFALERIENFKEALECMRHTRTKIKAFKDMDSQYHEGMLPHCPECGEVFDPMKIQRWTNRKYCDKEIEVNP